MRMHTGLHIQQTMDNHIRLHTMVQQLMRLSNKQMSTIMHMRIANMKFVKKLSDGYVKLNTIRNEMEFSGYFNIKYKKLDHLIVTMIVDGETFEFTY